MKKIIIVLEDLTEITVGHANSIYEWILEIQERVIVPFHGRLDYAIVHNVYYEAYDQCVTFKSE